MTFAFAWAFEFFGIPTPLMTEDLMLAAAVRRSSTRKKKLAASSKPPKLSRPEQSPGEEEEAARNVRYGVSSQANVAYNMPKLGCGQSKIWTAARKVDLGDLHAFTRGSRSPGPAWPDVAT